MVVIEVLNCERVLVLATSPMLMNEWDAVE